MYITQCLKLSTQHSTLPMDRSHQGYDCYIHMSTSKVCMNIFFNNIMFRWIKVYAVHGVYVPHVYNKLNVSLAGSYKIAIEMDIQAFILQNEL